MASMRRAKARPILEESSRLLSESKTSLHAKEFDIGKAQTFLSQQAMSHFRTFSQHIYFDLRPFLTQTSQDKPSQSVYFPPLKIVNDFEIDTYMCTEWIVD